VVDGSYRQLRHGSSSGYEPPAGYSGGQTVGDGAEGYAVRARQSDERWQIVSGLGSRDTAFGAGCVDGLLCGSGWRRNVLQP
jgi:hypothetical protein